MEGWFFDKKNRALEGNERWIWYVVRTIAECLWTDTEQRIQHTKNHDMWWLGSCILCQCQWTRNILTRRQTFFQDSVQDAGSQSSQNFVRIIPCCWVTVPPWKWVCRRVILYFKAYYCLSKIFPDKWRYWWMPREMIKSITYVFGNSIVFFYCDWDKTVT